MPRVKQKLCMGCRQPFAGRSDAKTCSPKCRKRFQRARVEYFHMTVPEAPAFEPEARTKLLRRVYARR